MKQSRDCESPKAIYLSVKAALAFGKKSLSPVDDDDDGGLGSGLSSGSQSKNCHSYLKLIVSCFFAK